MPNSAANRERRKNWLIVSLGGKCMKCEWADNLYIVRKDGMPHDQRY